MAQIGVVRSLVGGALALALGLAACFFRDSERALARKVDFATKKPARESL